MDNYHLVIPFLLTFSNATVHADGSKLQLCTCRRRKCQNPTRAIHASVFGLFDQIISVPYSRCWKCRYSKGHIIMLKQMYSQMFIKIGPKPETRSPSANKRDMSKYQPAHKLSPDLLSVLLK